MTSTRKWTSNLNILFTSYCCNNHNSNNLNNNNYYDYNNYNNDYYFCFVSTSCVFHCHRVDVVVLPWSLWGSNVDITFFFFFFLSSLFFLLKVNKWMLQHSAVKTWKMWLNSGNYSDENARTEEKIHGAVPSGEYCSLCVKYQPFKVKQNQLTASSRSME